MLKVKLHGLDEIEKNLKKLKGRKGANIIAAGNRAATVVLKKAAESNLPPKHRGKLGGPVKSRSKTPYSTTHKYGTSEEHWQLVFLEYGVPAHEITPKRMKVLSDMRTGFISKKVQHPGIRPIFWLSRSLTSGNFEKAVKAMSDRIWKRLKKEWK